MARNLTDFMLFYNTPLTDYQNTIHFRRNAERDKKFLKENEMELTDLKREKRKLKELVIILKKQYNISLRNIAKELHMGRETIRKLYDE